jgi:hypothetical protein
MSDASVEKKVERIMAVIDREGAPLPIAEWIAMLKRIEPELKSRIDAAKDDVAMVERRGR